VATIFTKKFAKFTKWKVFKFLIKLKPVFETKQWQKLKKKTIATLLLTVVTHATLFTHKVHKASLVII